MSLQIYFLILLYINVQLKSSDAREESFFITKLWKSYNTSNFALLLQATKVSMSKYFWYNTSNFALLLKATKVSMSKIFWYSYDKHPNSSWMALELEFILLAWHKKETRMVKSRCTLKIQNSGVYALTNTLYKFSSRWWLKNALANNLCMITFSWRSSLEGVNMVLVRV